MKGISINLERNAFKGEKSRIVSCDICQVWAILVSMFPSFLRYKEGTGGRRQIEPGPLVLTMADDIKDNLQFYIMLVLDLLSRMHLN